MERCAIVLIEGIYLGYRIKVMTLEEYSALIENAFKMQDWNYSKNDIKDGIVFKIDFWRNEEYYTKCRVFVYKSGICDMEASLPFKCPKEVDVGIELSYFLSCCNYAKRYATIRYNFTDGEIVNSYSFDIVPSMTSEFILSKFNVVKDIDEDDYNYIENLCKSQDARETQSVELSKIMKKEDKYKIDL